MVGDKETLRRQVMQKDLKLKVGEAMGEVESEVGKTHIAQEVNREKLNLRVNDAIKQIDKKANEKEK